MSVGGRHIVLAQLRMPGRRDAGGLDNVLECIGDAVQWPTPPAGHQLALCGCRLAQCELGCRPDEAVQFAVMSGDAVEQRPRYFHRRQFALVVKPVELGDRQKGGIHGGRLAAMGEDLQRYLASSLNTRDRFSCCAGTKPADPLLRVNE